MGSIKSDVWQQENEWRLMWQDDEKNKEIYQCPIEDQAISAVYLGLAIEEEEEKRFTHEVKNKLSEAKIFKTQKRPGSLALEFHSL